MSGSLSLSLSRSRALSSLAGAGQDLLRADAPRRRRQPRPPHLPPPPGPPCLRSDVRQRAVVCTRCPALAHQRKTLGECCLHVLCRHGTVWLEGSGAYVMSSTDLACGDTRSWYLDAMS
eukprot:790620-Rhodomonas_salina.2